MISSQYYSLFVCMINDICRPVSKYWEVELVPGDTSDIAVMMNRAVSEHQIKLSQNEQSGTTKGEMKQFFA